MWTGFKFLFLCFYSLGGQKFSASNVADYKFIYCFQQAYNEAWLTQRVHKSFVTIMLFYLIKQPFETAQKTFSFDNTAGITKRNYTCVVGDFSPHKLSKCVEVIMSRNDPISRQLIVYKAISFQWINVVILR